MTSRSIEPVAEIAHDITEPIKVFGGCYEAQKLLKCGNGVETLLGIDLTTDNPVIIKTTERGSLSLTAQIRLEHEAGVLSRLASPYLAPLLSMGREDNLLYLVVPFIHGETLLDRLQSGALTISSTLAVADCLLSALQEIHEHGVLHRDLKPANIIVNGDEPISRATLIDFGLARSARLDSAVRNQPVGTARYIAPEQAGLLDHVPDERADLYTLGVVLFECIAGEAPFQGSSMGEVLRQHMTRRPPELRSTGRACPRALDEIIQRLLRKDPRDRYQTASAVLADITRIREAMARGENDPALAIGVNDRRKTLTEPAFVGRDKELSLLDKQVEAAGKGKGGLVLLEAESGGGKTRLLTELAQRASRHDAIVFRGQGVDQAAQRPFQILVGVAAAILSRRTMSEVFADELRERLGDQALAVCDALPELGVALGVEVPEGTLGPELFGQNRSIGALSALLDALGTEDRPAVLLLDDCQWADEQTLKLFRRWEKNGFEGARHAMLVLAFRTEEVPPDHVLRRARATTQLKLGAFSREHTKELAESMAGPLPDDALEVVRRLSEGSPFMTSAVLQGMVESGALISDDENGWRTDVHAMADVQSSRHAAAFLMRRIDLLPPEIVELLTAAAVLGKEHDLESAARLAKQEPGQAYLSFQEAQRRQLVWPGAHEGQWAFIHDKLRQALLERLDPLRRRKLHARAAKNLESQSPDRVFDLAYHFDAAGEPRRAFSYAIAAAQQARARHSLEIAEQQYRIAERGVGSDDPKSKFRVAEGLGQVLMLRGRYQESERELRTALALSEDGYPRADVEGKLGELAFKRGDFNSAGEHLEQGLRRLGRRVPRSGIVFLLLILWESVVQALHTLFPRWFLHRRSLENAEPVMLALRLYSRLAILYWFHRGTIPSLWVHLHELNLAETYPPTPELAQAYSEHAPGMSLVGWCSRGISYVKRSLEIRREQGDLWGQGQSFHFYGVVLYADSHFRESIEKCREAIRLLERTGDHWEMNTARFQVAASHYRLGHLSEAVTEAQRMYQSGIDLGDAQASGISLDVWARASLGKVPPEIIHAELKRPSRDIQRKAQIMLAEGVRLIYANRAPEAVVILEQAAEMLTKSRVMNAWVAPVLPWLVTALRKQAEKSQTVTPHRRRDLLRKAKRFSKAAVRLSRRFQNELPHALRERALVAAMLGKSRKARQWFDESIELATRQHARYEQAQSRQAKATVGVELGWDRAESDFELASRQVQMLETEIIGTNEKRSDSGLAVVTLSLADRFDTVLHAGRRIAGALNRQAIFASVREGALKLLRAERCMVLNVNGEDPKDCTAISGEIEVEHSRELVRRALANGRATTFVEGVPDDSSESVLLSGVRSALCAPVCVRGKAVACFYVTHRQVTGLFGDDEVRLADFIATLAGAALENAEGFSELQRLNEALDMELVERKQAEKRIQEQAALLDEARDAISVQDLEDRIQYWNRSSELLYGWTAAEVRGKKAGEILHTADTAEWREALETVLTEGEWTGELRQTNRDGKPIIVESRWTLVRDDEGRPKARLVVSTDVTEKKKLEERFLRAQRMESIGTLAGGIAHDINNVLAPILMSLELLKMEMPRTERLPILTNMEAVAHRGAEMVKQILSFARGVEGKRLSLQLKHLVKELERMLTQTFPKNIEILANVDPNLWIISGDPTQLHQMLMNLGVNARDALPKGGKLTYRATNVVVTEDMARQYPDAEPGPYVQVTVTDTGTGIPPEVQERMFDPFFTTKEMGKGTGLGLSTVVGIVKGHEGFLQVQSIVGQGTEFHLFFPAAEENVEVPGVSEIPALPRGNGELILVVDDEAPILDITSRNLEAFGYRVLTARNGVEAVALFGEHAGDISVVLTDMMMPQMDGATTIRTIQAMSVRDVPMIAMSGLPSQLDPYRDDASSGALAVLQKPCRTEELLQTLQTVLSRG